MREEVNNTRKLGNKGFSLIELIIVIAIMAILIGIVGTQVVPYIEKSKQAKDQQILSGLLTSATTAFSSNAEIVDGATGPLTFTVGASGTGGASASLASPYTKISDEFYDLSGISKTSAITDLQGKMGSKASDDITSITITRDTSNIITVTTNMKSGTKYANVFGPLSST